MELIGSGMGSNMSWVKGNNIMVRLTKHGQDYVFARATESSSQDKRMIVLVSHPGDLQRVS
jgi:hypothetical protein